MGFQNFSNSSSKPYPDETTITYSELKTVQDYYTSYIQNNWSSNSHKCGLGWNDRFWAGGDYLFGNTNAIYNAGNKANVYPLAVMALAATSGDEPLTTINTHNWQQEFWTSLVRQQDRYADGNNPTSNYSITGRIRETSCTDSTWGCGNDVLATAWSCLALNPYITGNKPPSSESFVASLVAGQTHYFKPSDFCLC